VKTGQLSGTRSICASFCSGEKNKSNNNNDDL